MLIVLVYSAAGGMLAGVYTDVFQGTIMIIASILIFCILKCRWGTVNMTTTIANTMADGTGQIL